MGQSSTILLTTCETKPILKIQRVVSSRNPFIILGVSDFKESIVKVNDTYYFLEEFTKRENELIYKLEKYHYLIVKKQNKQIMIEFKSPQDSIEFPMDSIAKQYFRKMSKHSKELDSIHDFIQID